MPDEQSATAGRRTPEVEPHLAVIMKHSTVRLYAVPILEQEVLAAGIRASHGQVERGVGRGCRPERVRVVRRYREDGHPTELVQRPRIHARRAQGRGIIAASHQRVLPDRLGLVARVVEVREAEAVARLVRYGSHRHELAGVAPAGAPQPALEGVLRQYNAPTQTVPGMGAARASRQDKPWRPRG